MVELIKITERNGKSVVSAKELYDFQAMIKVNGLGSISLTL